MQSDSHPLISASPPLWTPDTTRLTQARLGGYLSWLAATRGLRFADYEALWRWSTTDLEGFWRSIWDHFELLSDAPPRRMLTERRMPGAQWCSGTRLNFVQQVFRHARADQSALVYESESGRVRDIGWGELERRVAAFAATLRELGVQPGDRVAGFLPNVPETVIAFLAAASVGAIWSVASPDMGAASVIERFRQIEPVVLVACDGMQFGGQWRDRAEVVRQLLAALPSIRSLVLCSHLDGPRAQPALFAGSANVVDFDAACARDAVLEPLSLPFEHPLWIVYSSGTTGTPKAIVHGHGGIVLMAMVGLALHNDVRPRDRLMWMSSTGWIVWNIQVSALLLGATVVLTDADASGGGPTPDWNTLWRLVGCQRVSMFGTGSAFLVQCMKHGVVPKNAADLSALRSVGATGSPLPAACYAWAYDAIAADLHLMVVSGGTDIAGAFIACAPTLPTYAGEMQCRTLGAAVQAFDGDGKPVMDQVGELVCTEPLPSMPLFLWGDADGQRYRESYFDMFPGVWRHGDWIRLVERPEAVGAVIYGRSDATINRHGLRLGTAEIYGAIETVHEVVDSLAVDLEYLERPSALLLFVVLREGATLDAKLTERLRTAVRTTVSPRFVPDEIHGVAEVPRTLTGKKMELPLRRLLLGQAPDQALPRDAVANPGSLPWFIDFARHRLAAQAGAIAESEA